MVITKPHNRGARSLRAHGPGSGTLALKMAGLSGVSQKAGPASGGMSEEAPPSGMLRAAGRMFTGWEEGRQRFCYNVMRQNPETQTCIYHVCTRGTKNVEKKVRKEMYQRVKEGCVFL